MARGTIAKDVVIAALKKAFGNKFLGEKEKKYYVVANDGENGEVQIAISLTCPKVEIEFAEMPSTGVDIENNTPLTPAASDIEFTKEEQDNIDRLMKMFNL